VFLDPSKFVIDGDKIHVLSAQRLAPVNFAACWNCRSEPPNYVDVAASYDVVHPLVPPILWRETADSLHLMFDFFRNTWAVDHRAYSVPVPRIRIVDPETVDEGSQPWLAAAERSELRTFPALQYPPFWSHYTQGSALIRELFRKD
jgi:hypothetical protein